MPYKSPNSRLAERRSPNAYIKPGRGQGAFVEKWLDRMASRYTIVEVRCSTDPQPEDEPQRAFKIHDSEHEAWIECTLHMKWMKTAGALQPGVYTITIPGTDRKHSFEVE
ncbi:MAG: hypothetical protein ACR2RF_28580 [Geminicoccaceae bacterium]